MKPVQLKIHVICDSEERFKQILSWDATLQSMLHSVGCGDWYTNTWYDKDTLEGRSQFLYDKGIFQDVIADTGLEAYIEEEDCEVKPVLN